MILAFIAVVILIMKLAEVGPVANWSWLWVLLPFVALFIWWEFLAEAIGWDKKQAADKRKADEKAAEEYKKKMRGY